MVPVSILTDLFVIIINHSLNKRIGTQALYFSARFPSQFCDMSS